MENTEISIEQKKEEKEEKKEKRGRKRRSKFKVTVQKIKEFFRKNKKNTVQFFIFISFPVLFGIIFFIILPIFEEKKEDITIKNVKDQQIEYYSDQLSIDAKINKLKKSYVYFSEKATDKEKIMRWIDLYFEAEYRRDGDGERTGEYDCSYALINYFWSFGSEMKLENVEALHNRIKSLLGIRQIVQKNERTITTGDLLILKIGGIWHCGLVINLKKGYIQYFDVNIKVDGMGWSQIDYKSKNVVGIYEMSFALWLGDSLKSR